MTLVQTGLGPVVSGTVLAAWSIPLVASIVPIMRMQGGSEARPGKLHGQSGSLDIL